MHYVKMPRSVSQLTPRVSRDARFVKSDVKRGHKHAAVFGKKLVASALVGLRDQASTMLLAIYQLV